MHIGQHMDIVLGVWRVVDAVKAALNVKTNLRRRYGDYSSVIEHLKNKSDLSATIDISREVDRLGNLFKEVANLIGEYTAAPGDRRLTKLGIKIKRAVRWEDVEKELNDIDRETMRQLAIMNLKGALSSSEMKVPWGVDQKVDNRKSLVSEKCPPSLPDQNCRCCW